jgi:hypothetical protein
MPPPAQQSTLPTFVIEYCESRTLNGTSGPILTLGTHIPGPYYDPVVATPLLGLKGQCRRR